MAGTSTLSSLSNPGFCVSSHFAVICLFFWVFTHGFRMVFALGTYDRVTRLVRIAFGRMSTKSTARTGISASGVFTCTAFCFSIWHSFRTFQFRPFSHSSCSHFFPAGCKVFALSVYDQLLNSFAWYLGVRVENGLHRQGYRRQESERVRLFYLAVQIPQLDWYFCMVLALLWFYE